MKSEKGLIHLLIAGEVVVLVLILVLGILKQAKGPEETVHDIVSTQDNWLETEASEAESQTEVLTENDETPAVTQETFSEEVEAVLAEMTLEEKVAQLFLVTPEALTGTERVTIAGNATRDALEKYPVGGIIYARGNYQGREQLKGLITGAQEISFEQSGEYLFAGTLSEVEEQKLLAIAWYGTEEALVELVRVGGNTNQTAIDGLTQIPLLQSIEEIAATENLKCVVIEEDGIDAVLALQSGADMLYVTEDFEANYERLLLAVQENEVTEAQVNLAVGHILEKKQGLSGQVENEE